MQTIKFLLIAMMAAMMTSCGVSTLVYDKTVPEDQLSTLVIPMYYTVTSFDAKKVKWRGKIFSNREVKIPVGKHIIGYKYQNMQMSERTQSAQSVNRGNFGDGRMVNTTTFKSKKYKRQVTINFETGTIYTLR